MANGFTQEEKGTSLKYDYVELVSVWVIKIENVF